jgi:hypothetical protein
MTQRVWVFNGATGFARMRLAMLDLRPGIGYCSESSMTKVVREETPLRIAVCWRPVAARAGEEHVVTRLLRAFGHDVVQTQDGSLHVGEFDVVWILENCHWFPKIVREVGVARRRARRPLLVVWHWEPLPLPKTSGVSLPWLSGREMAKILLRDTRATDVYTNLYDLWRLSRQGLPDLLAVSSGAWKESLDRYGIPSEWVPYGYEEGDGAPLDVDRDIAALFLGALEIPRRKRIIGRLRRRGVEVAAYGSWFEPSTWGRSRTHLINRAETFLNIQRYPREISAHRLILGMANRSLVVSEPIYRPQPFVPGQHYVEVDVADVPDALSYYRAHPTERGRIVECAYRFVTEELRMETSVAQLLSLLRRGSW